jgi:class 3 adenylate cyclase/tetratricopeptide (TPR) repeat protein
VVCAACGSENPGGFRFCGSCGAALAPAEAPRELRKVVTVVFCDLSGSTALGDRTDPETLRATMRSYYEAMRMILERHGGTVEKFVGDAVMAVFGVPLAHEDDALRAVRAAWEMRAAVPGLGLAARIGVNTGEVVAGEGDTLVTGDAVNVAARLEQAAAAGDVLIGAGTRRLVRDAVSCEQVVVDAKGKGTVDAFRLVEVDLSAPALARHLDAPLVGRSPELEVLRQAASRSVSESSCHLFTLLGTAGVGKSRLVAEFLGGSDAQVVRGRCLDYGEGITFWPVVEVLKQLGPRADSTMARLVAGASSPSELFFLIRRLLEEVARERPLVVVFDDIHWGEPTFLDLLDHIADLSRGAPILLLCLARPELLDERPGWGGGKLNATTLLLEPLSADECARLIEELDGEVDAATRARIIESADGNPLFAEEMLALARDGGDIGVPSTIHALLQARLDRLGADERAVIESGAVEGQVFHRSAVHELAREAARDGVEQNLVGLVRKELIRPDQATFPNDDAFRFRHLLIRDAAYDSLPKEARADLHERFGDWLENRTDLVELDEIVGFHLEQAVEYRRELGTDDASLAARAARHLGRAGRAALGRTDLHAAGNLLERSLVLFPRGDRESAVISLVLADACQAAGGYDRTAELLGPLTRSADPLVRAQARVLAAHVRLQNDPHGAAAEATAVLDDVLSWLETAGDDTALARSYLLASEVHWNGSRAEPAMRAARQALEHATRAGDERLRGVCAYYLAAAAAWGPFGPSEELAVVEELEGHHAETRMAQTGALFIRMHRAANRGDRREVRVLNDRLCAAHLEVGDEIVAHASMQAPVLIELWSGNAPEARRLAENAYRNLLRLGAVGFASTTAVLLAEVLYASGERDEAERTAIEGENLGGAEDVVNFAIGRGVRARVAADRGDLAAADELARDAVRYALETDFPVMHGDAYRALAYVRHPAGRPDEERNALEEALAAYRRKDIVPMIRETELLLEAMPTG